MSSCDGIGWVSWSICTLIDLECFCPLERAVEEIRVRFHPEKLIVKYPGDVASPRAINVKVADNALGLSVAQREKLMKADAFKFGVSVTVGDDTIDYPVHVFNNLLTDTLPLETMQFKGKVIYNGHDANGNKICYPEAILTSGSNVAKAVSHEKRVPGLLRPLYAYEYVGLIDDEIVINGPKSEVFDYSLMYNLVISGKPYSVVEKFGSVLSEFHEVATVVPTEPTAQSVIIYAKVNVGGKETEVNVPLGQFANGPNGVNFDMSDVLRMYKCACYFELVRENYIADDEVLKKIGIGIRDNALIFNMELFDGHYVLDAGLVRSIDVMISHQHLLACLDGLRATRDSILLNIGGNSWGEIASTSKNQSCFVWSLAFIFAMNTKCRIYNQLCAMVAMGRENLVSSYKLDASGNLQLENGMPVVDPLGVFGVTAKYDGLEKELLLDSIELPKLTFKRKTVSFDSASRVFLYGLSFENNAVDGVPDHYVVAVKEDDVIRVLYNPSNRKYFVGDDITYLHKKYESNKGEEVFINVSGDGPFALV